MTTKFINTNSRIRGMAAEESEKEVERLLKLRLLMAESSMGEPFLEGTMLVKLMDAYDENRVKMPGPLMEFIRHEGTMITGFLENSIEKKKSELQMLQLKREELFAREIAQLEESHKRMYDIKRRLSRTEEIWGLQEDY